MRKIDKIIVHCSATPVTATVEDIRKYHLSLGYKYIAYHYIVGFDGRLYFGRPVSEVGAHCKGENQHSIGICLIGGKDRFDFSLSQLVTLCDLIKLLCYKNDLSIDNVFSHYEFNKNKNCPWFNIKNLLRYENFKKISSRFI